MQMIRIDNKRILGFYKPVTIPDNIPNPNDSKISPNIPYLGQFPIKNIYLLQPRVFSVLQKSNTRYINITCLT